MELKKMKRMAKIALSLLLVIAMFPILQPVEAAEGWTEHKAQPNIETDREWKVNFSDIATEDKIKRIHVKSGDRNIPVTLTYDKTETVKVKPDHRYLSGQKHTLEIELANGRKDKMDFTTNVESFENNQRIYTDEIVKGKATKEMHFYSIRPTEDGELIITGSTEKGMALYLYDDKKEKGEFLGFTEEGKNPTLSRELKRNKIYYIGVEATGDYRLSSSVKGKPVTPDSSLEKAQAAVNALPAPMDVMDKHRYEIDQAKTFIAIARLFKADSLQIERMEEKIAALEDIIKPLELVNVEVLNASTFEIQFNRAVNPELMTLKLTEQTTEQTIDRKYIVFNANRTFATITRPTKLTAGKKTVSALFPMLDPLEKEFLVVGEKVTTIEILGDTAVRVAGNKVSIGYRALNQYGEEIVDADLTAEATGDVVASGNIELSDGRVLIPINPDEIKEGEEIELTLYTGDDLQTKKKVKVSTKASVYKLDILDLKSKAGTLKETTDLKNEEFYLLVKATDQFGAPITSKDELEDTYKLTNTNPNVVQFEEALVAENAAKGLYKLKLTGEPTVGRTTVVLTVNASNEKSEPYPITVGEGQRVDTFTLDIPEHITAGSDLKIKIKALDKDGDEVNDLDIITGSISGIAWTITDNIPYKVKKLGKDGQEVQDDETAGELYLTFKGEDIDQGTLEIKGVTSTNNKNVEKIEVKEKAVPTTWTTTEVLSPFTFEKDKVLENGEKAWNKESVIIHTDKIKVKDQYENEMSGLPAGYSLKGKTNEKAVKVNNTEEGNVEIQPNAVGTATVTISLYKGDVEVAGSGREFTFTTKDGTGYIGYEVEPIGMVYDMEDVEKDTHGAYKQELIVLGIVNDKGAKVKLEPDSEFKLSEEESAKGIKLDKNGKISIDEKFYYSGTSIKLDLVIEIVSTGETFTEEVTLSKEQPRVKVFEASNEPIKLNTAQDLDWNLILSNVRFTAKDQYGVTIDSDELKETAGDDKLTQLKFPDGTEIKPTIKFEKIKGSQLFENNGKHNAKGTNYSADSEVKATITANDISTAVNIKLEEDHMPEVKKVAEEFELPDNEKMLDKKTEDLLEKVSKYVKHSDYKIAISSVDNKDLKDMIIDEDGKVYSVPCKHDEDCNGGVEVDVTFMIFHNTEKELQEELATITFTVPRATEVLISGGSLGKAGNHVITELEEGKEYIVFEGGKYYAVIQSAKGNKNEDEKFSVLSSAYDTKSEAEKASEGLAGTSIRQLTNGKTYKVEEVAPKQVGLIDGSKGKAGNKIITGLEEKHRYVISYKPANSTTKVYHGVDGNGDLIKPFRENRVDASKDAEFLNVTTIKGLTNGVEYKVENSTPYQVKGLKAKLLDTGNVELNFPEIYTDKIEVHMRDGDEWKKVDLVEEIKIGIKSAETKTLNLEPGKKYQFKLVITDDRYDSESDKAEIKIERLKIINTDINMPEPGIGESQPDKDKFTWATNQYTIENISWNQKEEVFKEGKYKLTIKIKPTSSYTLDGLKGNSFQVQNADETKYEQGGEFGVITAEFTLKAEPDDLEKEKS